MIPIIGFQFNISIIETYYTAERYSLDHFFLFMERPTKFWRFTIYTLLHYSVFTYNLFKILSKANEYIDLMMYVFSEETF